MELTGPGTDRETATDPADLTASQWATATSWTYSRGRLWHDTYFTPSKSERYGCGNARVDVPLTRTSGKVANMRPLARMADDRR